MKGSLDHFGDKPIDVDPIDFLSKEIINQIRLIELVRRCQSKENKKSSIRRSGEMEEGLWKIYKLSSHLCRVYSYE